MQENYDLLVCAMGWFKNDYREYEKVTFYAGNGYTIYNVIEVEKHYLSVDDNGNIVMYADEPIPKIEGAICLSEIKSGRVKLMEIARWLTKLNII